MSFSCAEESLAINRSSPSGEIRRFVNFAIKRGLKQAEGVDYQRLPLGYFFCYFFLRAEDCAEDCAKGCAEGCAEG